MIISPPFLRLTFHQVCMNLSEFPQNCTECVQVLSAVYEIVPSVLNFARFFHCRCLGKIDVVISPHVHLCRL